MAAVVSGESSRTPSPGWAATPSLPGGRPPSSTTWSASIKEGGGECTAIPTNIRDTDQVDALRDEVYERFGRTDYLINNAGGQFPAVPSAISDNGWRSVVDLNLNGTWNMIGRFMPPMAEAGSGAIVNVVTLFSFERGAPMFLHSGAARAGVVNMTKTLAPYLMRHGVTINVLAPGVFTTPALIASELGPLGHTEESFLDEVVTQRMSGPPRHGRRNGRHHPVPLLARRPLRLRRHADRRRRLDAGQLGQLAPAGARRVLRPGPLAATAARCGRRW